MMVELEFDEKDPTECSRCHSLDTKFCYYNNKKLSQPRYRCNSCLRKFTKGGRIRDVPPKKADKYKSSIVSKITKRSAKSKQRTHSQSQKLLQPPLKQLQQQLDHHHRSSEEDEYDIDIPVKRRVTTRSSIKQRTSSCRKSSSSDFDEEEEEEDDEDEEEEEEEDSDVQELQQHQHRQQQQQPREMITMQICDKPSSSSSWSFKSTFDKIKKAILDGYDGIVYS